MEGRLQIQFSFPWDLDSMAVLPSGLGISWTKFRKGIASLPVKHKAEHANQQTLLSTYHLPGTW